MEALDYINEKIQYCINADKTDIVIVPMGRWGSVAKKILNEEYGVQESFCLDNYRYDDINIYPIKNIPNIDKSQIYLLVVEDEIVRQELSNQLFSAGVKKEQILYVFSDELILRDMCEKYGKINLDFLCVGFQKCGTSSLWAAMIKNPKIFLPKEKETYFIHNFHQKLSHEMYMCSYPEEYIKNKCVGGIEPTYLNCAKGVFEYYGSNLKILICVRNPADAIFSLFKMGMRDGNDVMIDYYKYLEKGREIPDVFDMWIEKERMHSFEYMNYIEEYLKYYRRDQIKIIILEEFQKNFRKEMREIQEFIGLVEKDILEYEDMPWVNEGSGIPVNLAGMCINRSINKLIEDTSNVGLRKDLMCLRTAIYKMTNKKTDDKMHVNTYKKLMSYYFESIHELEKFLDKSLQGLWY